jgi:glycosyltransferase involved in cell wall biosynthesis
VVASFDEVHHVPWTRRPTDPVNMTSAVRAIRNLVAQERYDLVHVHDPVAAFVTRFALRRARAAGIVKVVYTAHGFHFFRGNAPHRNLVFRSLERLAAAWTDYLVVINQEDLAAARRFPVAGEVVYMPGIGVDTSRYDPAAVSDEDVTRVRRELGLGRDQKLLLFVGELNPGKRHRDAVEALARTGRSDIVLACAGVGPLAQRIAAQASRLGIADRVRLLGYRDDIQALLRAAFALVLPSEREGLPRCLMEASCLERPVIGTRIRGTTELVEDGETGILVDVGDVDALADAIVSLADDPALAKAMGRRGREAMRRFDLSHVMTLHEELYAKALASGGEPRMDQAQSDQ